MGLKTPPEAAELVMSDIRKMLDEERIKQAQEQASADRMREMIKKRIEDARDADEKRTSWVKEYLKFKLTDDYKKQVENALAEKQKKLEKSKLANELLKKMMSADCKNLNTSKQIQKELFEQGMIDAGDNLDDLRERGLTPSLSSGLQAPGTFTPVKGLFN
jgi:hypothetical protein